MSAPVIFIVDDDAAVRDSLVMLLRLAGHYVEAFESAVRFLSDARPKSGDCLIADIRMPEMDGLTAMREIRKRPDWKKLPIIALTAKAMRDDQEKCLAAGANDYIAKPLDVEKLMSLVRVWMPK